MDWEVVATLLRTNRTSGIDHLYQLVILVSVSFLSDGPDTTFLLHKLRSGSKLKIEEVKRRRREIGLIPRNTTQPEKIDITVNLFISSGGSQQTL